MNGQQKQIQIDETNIAWSSDIQYKFKNLDDKGLPEQFKSYKDIQWLDMQNGKYFSLNSLKFLSYRALHRLDENCRSA